MGRGAVGYEMTWKTFYLVANKFFASASNNPMVLGGLAIETDTADIEVVVSGGGGNDDSDVYKYGAGLTSIDKMTTLTPVIPTPGIGFPNGFLVDIDTSPGVSVLYKGDLA